MAAWVIAVAVVIPSVVLIVAFFIGVYFYRRHLLKRQAKKLDDANIQMAQSIMNLPGSAFIPYQSMVIHEIIGEGSYGSVYRGEWQGSSVALKIPKKSVSGQFLEELRMMLTIKCVLIL